MDGRTFHPEWSSGFATPPSTRPNQAARPPSILPKPSALPSIGRDPSAPNRGVIINLGWDYITSEYILPVWLEWAWINTQPTVFFNCYSFRKVEQAGLPYPAIVKPSTDSQWARCGFCLATFNGENLRKMRVEHIRSDHGISVADSVANVAYGRKWSGQEPKLPTSGVTILTFVPPNIPPLLFASTNNRTFRHGHSARKQPTNETCRSTTTTPSFAAPAYVPRPPQILDYYRPVRSPAPSVKWEDLVVDRIGDCVITNGTMVEIRRFFESQLSDSSPPKGRVEPTSNLNSDEVVVWQGPSGQRVPLHKADIYDAVKFLRLVDPSFGERLDPSLLPGVPYTSNAMEE